MLIINFTALIRRPNLEDFHKWHPLYPPTLDELDLSRINSVFGSGPFIQLEQKESCTFPGSSLCAEGKTHPKASDLQTCLLTPRQGLEGILLMVVVRKVR